MAKPVTLPGSVRGLLGFNAVLHLVSAIFAAIWVARLVAPQGALSALNWVEVLLSAAAVAAGLTYGSFLALRYLPALPPSLRRGAIIAFIAAYSALAIVLAVAASSALAATAGERAHMEASLAAMRTATEDRRRAFASIVNRAPALLECIDTASAMSRQEAATGAFSREGGDVGRVAITLSNIAKGCSTARDALYANRAQLVRLFDRLDRRLLDIRRVIDSDIDSDAKLIAVRKHGEEYQRLTRAVNDALAVEVLQGVSDAMLRDWYAAGLPARGAAAITQNFAGLAEALVEGLDDIAALRNETPPSVAAVSSMEYLTLYPKATVGALAIGVCIEMIPLGAILIGFAIMSQEAGRSVRGRTGGTSSPAPAPSEPAARVSAPRRGRPRKTKV
ncbi:hypothetical protein [Sandarakinorhabdus sp.]|uniref:hypothetical protein n=1 Tax=Sandarakinorhabdus sp. TaxID=1916663 RepID=UPI00286E5259|nr:hypothetical protein [Sandarakinorhabdus sp.]